MRSIEGYEEDSKKEALKKELKEELNKQKEGIGWSEKKQKKEYAIWRFL